VSRVAPCRNGSTCAARFHGCATAGDTASHAPAPPSLHLGYNGVCSSTRFLLPALTALHPVLSPGGFHNPSRPSCPGLVLLPLQGGLYAPSIFIGASLGTAYGLIVHAVGDPLGLALSAPQAYALVGERCAEAAPSGQILHGEGSGHSQGLLLRRALLPRDVLDAQLQMFACLLCWARGAAKARCAAVRHGAAPRTTVSAGRWIARSQRILPAGPFAAASIVLLQPLWRPRRAAAQNSRPQGSAGGLRLVE
jgi:hypothetical protein